MVKQYIITRHVHRTENKSDTEPMNIAELVKYYQYTLEKGRSWEHEKGNKKINCNPKSINSLVKNLNNAVDNAAANGYAGVTYTANSV